MRTFFKRHVLAATVAAAVLAGGVGAAIAQSGGGASDPDAGASSDPASTSKEVAAGTSPADPQSGERGVGVPEGPFVDFCPSPEQTEEHWKQYEFDYKPVGVACTREGEVAPPENPVDDPEANLSEEQMCEVDKALLRSARTIPDGDGDPKTIHGVLPDGREVIVGVMGEVEEGWTLKDEASVLGC